MAIVYNQWVNPTALASDGTVSYQWRPADEIKPSGDCVVIWRGACVGKNRTVYPHGRAACVQLFVWTPRDKYDRMMSKPHMRDAFVKAMEQCFIGDLHGLTAYECGTQSSNCDYSDLEEAWLI